MKLGKQYKIWVGCPEASEIIQKHAFKLGQRWSGNKCEVQFTECKWLTFWDDGTINYSTYGFDEFMRRDFQEISIADFLKIKPESNDEITDFFCSLKITDPDFLMVQDVITELHARIKKLEEAHNA